MGSLLLVDGNSLAYRAYFALPTDLATASGQVTNAVFGFTSMLVNLIASQEPSGLAVAFDRPEPTFRHSVLDSYKAGRAETPDLLRQQMGLVRQVVDVLGIPVVDCAGYEADDVIATLATRAADQGREVTVVTGDRDAFQLVQDPLVRVLYNRRGVSDYVLYDEAGIRERTGVSPSQYAIYAALRGDPSDNLPGVPGVGEKTAARLVNGHSNLEEIFENLGGLSARVQEAVLSHREQVYTNAQLIPLVRDVPIEVAIDDLKMGGWEEAEVRRVFQFLEMRSLWDRLVSALGGDQGRLPSDTGAGTARLDVRVTRLADVASTAPALASFMGCPGLAVQPAWEAQPGRSSIVGLAFVPFGHSSEESSSKEVDATWVDGRLLEESIIRETLSELLSSHGPPLVAHHAKELMRALGAWGIRIASLELDTAVAAYLVDPGEVDYRIEELASRFAGILLDEAPPPSGQLRLVEADAPDIPLQACTRAAALSRLAEAMRKALAERGQERLYDEIERPLVGVLAQMELTGIRVDTAYLSQLVKDLSTEALELEESIQELAGTRFKVNSTPQLREVLYTKLGLQPQRKTKTGYSTDAATLERLRDQHPVVAALLRYREVEKLRSTFGVGLLAEVAPDGRIHASFNQTVARTGRLSSDQPNLHNIPVRSEDGRRFRRAFVPAEGCRLLVADYDQIELRVIAHLSGDPGLTEAFRTGRDIHATTAAAVFGVEVHEVTPAMRAKAKMVSYGLAYGMEAYGLSRRLGVGIPEAESILAAYFDAFPSVKEYMEKTVDQARSRGYTETAFGRRRAIPELASSNFRVRQAGERQAMNAGIQGLAADLFKVALVRLDRQLADLESRLVLQVHDEVLLEVPPEEEGRAGELVDEVMRNAADLSVPLAVHISWGTSWDEAKG